MSAARGLSRGAAPARTTDPRLPFGAVRAWKVALVGGVLALSGCSSKPWQTSASVVSYNPPGSYTVKWSVRNVGDSDLRLVCRVALSSGSRQLGQGPVHPIVLALNQSDSETDAVTTSATSASLSAQVVCLN